MLLPFFKKGQVEAGCDEAGRGCLAGPVVAAAVILPQDYSHPKLNDSKLLSEKVRNQLEIEIEKDALSYAVGLVSPLEIDEINILNASFLAMHRAVAQLQLDPELLLIDGNRFNAYPNIFHECIIKGDSKYLSIAAASVLAKNHRDRLMRKLAETHPEYGWQTNVGYPTKAHRKAIKEFGTTSYHRMTFQLLPKQLDPLK
ncbi:MAG: ribonuclease HII [Cyclobacteriaceae bacterium]|jgi:ribonuclease HII